MSFLLDTDFCIDWLGRKDYARQALALVHPTEVSVSSVTVGELLAGAHCAQMPEREAGKVEAFLKPIKILDYGRTEASRFARISADLRQHGQLIGTSDTMIAATAECHRMTVITRNQKHFGKIETLKCENWEAKPPKARPAR